MRCAQNQLIVVDQIHQARVAFHEFGNQRHGPLQNFLQAHLANHEPAHPLKQAELLLSSLQPQLQISTFRHT